MAFFQLQVLKFSLFNRDFTAFLLYILFPAPVINFASFFIGPSELYSFLVVLLVSLPTTEAYHLGIRETRKLPKEYFLHRNIIETKFFQTNKIPNVYNFRNDKTAQKKFSRKNKYVCRYIVVTHNFETIFLQNEKYGTIKY